MATTIPSKLKGKSQEISFQVILHIVLLISFVYDRSHPHIHTERIFFFINYAIAAAIINYFLLPRFYYTKKYTHFFSYVGAILLGVILIEELILEQIYFPDSRGKVFSNIILTLIDVFPLILILSGFKFAWDAHHKQHQLNALQKLIRDSELQFLKSQINPHFLFNNLNNLYAYAIENSPKTPKIILELASVLRYMLYDCKEDFVRVTDEFKHLQNFTALNELQIEERGDIQFTTNCQNPAFKIAPLILMVFIENAFKHSTSSQSENIMIHIQALINEDGLLTFECVNSYFPNSNTNSLSKGIGLENVKKRLNLLYPDAHSLSIQEDGRQYRVSLSIQLTE